MMFDLELPDYVPKGEDMQLCFKMIHSWKTTDNISVFITDRLNQSSFDD